MYMLATNLANKSGVIWDSCDVVQLLIAGNFVQPAGSTL